LATLALGIAGFFIPAVMQVEERRVRLAEAG